MRQPGGPYNPIEGSMASFVFPVGIVKFLWTIDAQADKKAILVKELAPFVVKENPVGLEGVLDPGPGLLIFLLKFHGPLKEIEPHKCGLTPLPGDGDRGDLMSIEKLLNVSLMHFIRHAEIAPWIEIFFLQEKAIVAVQIAGRT